MSPTLYYGSFVHSTSLTTLEHCTSSLIYVHRGIIQWVEKNVDSSHVQEVAAAHGLMLDDVDVVELQGDFLVPGLVDTHTHAPQYPNLGLGGGYQLLDWLKHYTFPTESKFSDVDYANKIYQEVVKRNLAVGTTTCCYYGSLHGPATKLLGDIVHRSGQRALVGKCNMDRNCPSHYIESSPSESIDDTRSLIDYLSSLPVDPDFPSDPLVKPCITPRFAISCSDTLLEQLGRLAAEDANLAIQTHMSENTSEIDETLRLFPGCETYTEVYKKFGLLRRGTILAHCVHMSDEEMKMIKECEAGISHCPTSNLNLMSGGARVGAMLHAGIDVGLGSDCSGGFAIGVLPQLRNASMLSKLVALQSPPANGKYVNKPLSIPSLFHMATLGGATLCRAQEQIGNFLPGKEFDALRIRPGSNPNYFQIEKRTSLSQDQLAATFEQ